MSYVISAQIIVCFMLILFKMYVLIELQKLHCGYDQCMLSAHCGYDQCMLSVDMISACSVWI